MFNTLPTRFRHYEVLKLLGGGGFGVVYLARDTDLKRLVVLKMLHPHLAAQPDMVRRFVQEARAMARLDHVNIVRINQVKNDAQQPFFEMEYIEGQTLAKYRASQVFSLRQVIPIIKQIAAALDAAHQQKIIHRDVKPDNVLVKPNGQLKLTDFGIIKLLESTETLHPSTQGIIGTPSYMAPEQADLSRRQEIGPGCDIYALGVVTYELLTGHLPFKGTSYHTILGAHVTQPPPDPRTFNPFLTESTAQVLLKVLAKQPANRYLSATAFVNALELEAASGGAGHQSRISSLSRDGASQVAPASAPLVEPTENSVATISDKTAHTVSQPLAPQKQIAWPMAIGLGSVIMIIILIAVFARPLIFDTPDSAEPAIVIASTEAPAKQTKSPAKPTEGLASLTEVPANPTDVPPASMSTLGIGSTMQGQDGMTLLYVPEGEFLRGSKDNDPDGLDNEKPQRSIFLDAFWIDQTEVTNEMFARFVDDTGHQTKAEEAGWGYAFTEETWEVTDGAEWRHPQGPNSSIEGLEQHPVVQVSWNDAKTYCEWTGRRLPTEAEWEKAARGTDSRSYSWGNEEPASNLVNFCDKNCSNPNSKIDSLDDGYEFTAPVGTYPDGASPYGALDMTGNVWEWNADWYAESYYKDAPEQNPQGPDTGEQRVLRGGSWYDGMQKLRVIARDSYHPTNRASDYGFRCAVSH